MNSGAQQRSDRRPQQDRRRLRVAVSGAGGLVGSALRDALEQRGDEVLPLVRRQARQEGEIGWDPGSGLIAPAQAERLDALVHLAGENIADGRWTTAKKRRIFDSRGPATARLVESLEQLQAPPAALVCASASGYFGDRGDELLLEQTLPGDGFLADVRRAGAAAAGAAEDVCDRVAIARLGVVLSRRGGALGRMMPIFKLGMGGRLGSGDQYFPWITLEDAVAAFLLLIDDASTNGPYHLVGAEPVTNAEFTSELGRVLHRPTIVPAPAIGLRLVLGEAADEMLLASARLSTQRLLDAGFEHRHPMLRGALESVLG